MRKGTLPIDLVRLVFSDRDLNSKLERRMEIVIKSRKLSPVTSWQAQHETSARHFQEGIAPCLF